MGRVIRWLFFLVIILGLVGAIGYLFVRGRGFSARAEPGRIETTVARAIRRQAIPVQVRDRRSPLAPTADTVRGGLDHFADHCAICHGNDGSGDTEIGRAMYPKVPDMRRPDTQSLTDGELFYIIENGVPLTGMPAWGTGTPDGEMETWHLVHFIRHLPQVTEAELDEMKKLNPKTEDEWREEEKMQRFLEGGDVPAPKPSTPAHKHGGQK